MIIILLSLWAAFLLFKEVLLMDYKQKIWNPTENIIFTLTQDIFSCEYKFGVDTSFGWKNPRFELKILYWELDLEFNYIDV